MSSLRATYLAVIAAALQVVSALATAQNARQATAIVAPAADDGHTSLKL